MNNVQSLDELIRILKATRTDLSYAESDETGYVLGRMAEDLDACLQDLVTGVGGDAAAFVNCNTMAMDVALSSAEFDQHFDSYGEVPLLDPDFDGSW